LVLRGPASQAGLILSQVRHLATGWRGALQRPPETAPGYLPTPAMKKESHMSTSRPRRGEMAGSNREEPERLPLRWAMIGLVAVIAGVAAFPVGGPAAALVAAVVVAAGLHKMIA
jgi:hypothetical protein